MEHFGRFTILEPLTQGRIRSYRAWDPASKQVLILHLGWETEAEIPTLPPESVREKGKAEEKIYLLTPDLPEVHDLNVAAKPSAVPAGSEVNKSGEFTRMFQQWNGQASPMVTSQPGAGVPGAGVPGVPPELTPADSDADVTRLMPTPTWTPQMAQGRKSDPASGPKEKPPVPQIVKQVIRVGPSRAKASDQISNPALSLPDARFDKLPAQPGLPVLRPGEFTQAFQNPDSVTAPTPKPPARVPEQPGEFTQRFGEPLPATEPKEPGEFTLMFRPPASQIPPQKPVQSAPPEKTGKDFERIYQSSLPDNGREIDFKALEKNAPQKRDAPPKAAGEFTEMFGRPLSVDSPQSPPAHRGSMENSNATVLFESPALAAPKSDPMQPGEFTQAFSRPVTGSAAPPESATAPAAVPKPKAKAPIGALILIGAALIVIVILLFLFLLLRR